MARAFMLKGDLSAAARYLQSAKKYVEPGAERRRYQSKLDLLNAIAKQVSSGNLLSAIAPVIDGRGGGKPELAQGGGSKAGAVADAVLALTTAIESAQGK